MENIFNTLQASESPAVGSDATSTTYTVPISCKKTVTSFFAPKLANITPYRFDQNTFGRLALVQAPDCLNDINVNSLNNKNLAIKIGYDWSKAPDYVKLASEGNYSDGLMLYADFTF